jgi:hypothetical protein
MFNSSIENIDALGEIQNSPASLSWLPLKELPSLEVDVPTLPDNLVPEAFRGWLNDGAERMQIPLEMLVIPALVATSSIIGRRCGIHPFQRDPWMVVPNLWGMVVAPPGFLKSPALKEAVSPLLTLDNEAIAEFKKQEPQFAAKMFSIQSKIKGLKGRIEAKFQNHPKTHKQTDDLSLEDLEKKLAEAEAELKKEKKTCPRLTTSDATIEKLGELLEENPDGLFVFRDELYGFLIGLEKQGRESDRPFYLEAWNGNSPFIVDRIGRGSKHIEALCLSLLGGIQPERLGDYFSKVMDSDSADDGLFSRFQMTVFPLFPKKWKLVDRYPDSLAKSKATEIFKKIREMDFRGLLTGSQDIPATHFTEEAQLLFNNWMSQMENRIRSGEIESPAWIAHLAKYRSLMPSLALSFQVIDFASGNTNSLEVSLEAAQSAASFCEFLEAHGKKVYSGMLHPGVQAAHALAKRIKDGQITDGMTVREIYRKHWTQLNSLQKVECGLMVLGECQWVKVEEERQARGAPKDIVRIHPSLLKMSLL